MEYNDLKSLINSFVPNWLCSYLSTSQYATNPPWCTEANCDPDVGPDTEVERVVSLRLLFATVHLKDLPLELIQWFPCDALTTGLAMMAVPLTASWLMHFPQCPALLKATIVQVQEQGTQMIL
ncbi:hypothetical protein EMCRGX_G004503 [Ephydatia muelleri]